MNRIGPFLKTIVQRANVSLREASRRAGVSHVALYQQIRGRSSLSEETIVAILSGVHATTEECRRARVLLALDRGLIHLPSDCTEDRVVAALNVLEVR